jgi:hypothetical protein
MLRTRVHNFAISLDGFATGEGQSPESPFGHAGKRLHLWMFATRYGHTMFGKDGGGSGADDALAQQFLRGIGAEIMGGSSVRPDGRTTRTGRDGGVRTRLPYTDLHPHPSPSSLDRDGGRHDVPLP